MTIGVVLCLIIITGRIIINKNHEEVEESSKDEPKFHKSNTGETTITKGFSGDNICDMEGGDIDLTTPLGMGSLSAKNEVILLLLNDADTDTWTIWYCCTLYLASIYRHDMTTARKLSKILFDGRLLLMIRMSLIFTRFHLITFFLSLPCVLNFFSASAPGIFSLFFSFLLSDRSRRLTRTRHHFSPTSALYQRVHLHY